MEEVDSVVKVAVETEVQSESVIAESKRPEAQSTVSLAQPEASQGNYFCNPYCLRYFCIIFCVSKSCYLAANIFERYVISIL